MSTFDEFSHPRGGDGRFAPAPARAESGVDLAVANDRPDDLRAAICEDAGLTPGQVARIPSHHLAEAARSAEAMRAVREGRSGDADGLDEHIVSSARAECVRQHVGEDRVVTLLSAYRRGRDMARTDRVPDADQMLELAGMAEPDNKGRYRLTDVTFDAGGSATTGRDVEHVARRMFSVLDETSDPDEVTRSYLSVHPHTDGNGRTAWLLRTWLTDSWAKPEMLPDYGFGR